MILRDGPSSNTVDGDRVIQSGDRSNAHCGKTLMIIWRTTTDRIQGKGNGIVDGATICSSVGGDDDTGNV